MASSNLPHPLPPRTRTPPADEPYHGSGLGIAGNSENTPPSIHTHYDYDIHAGLTDSPEKPFDDARAADMPSSMLSPTSATFPASGGSGTYSAMTTPQTASTDGGFGALGAGANDASADGGAGAQGRSPFNFTTQQYVAGRGSVSKSEALGRRKGHKYRHSSIHASHMDSIFQSPAQKTPLTVPASLPMPTKREAWRSMTPNQTARLSWCLCHFIIAGYVQFSGAGSLSMTALSRLLLFDAAGATACVAVDVMSNFEVWKRSSIKHPFGLERADVLAGFGLAVFIAFMGLDIISHGIQHSLENLGHHESHSPHSHARVTTSSVDLTSLLAIGSTIISAVLLKNHSRIGRAMRLEFIASWGRIFGNPSHVLTLSCSVCLLIMPFLSIGQYRSFDLIFSFLIALLMIALGVRLGTSLASMLLMSYQPRSTDKGDVRRTIVEIEGDPGVSAMEQARFWQVHYGLCMANVRLRYRRNSTGLGEEVAKIRQRVVSLIRQRLGEVKGVSWEVTVQAGVEKD
jgi:divalent metal cation (Fe/Co/Zn/Cd) transporter